MIRSFKHKGLERFFLKGTKSGIMLMHNPPHPGEIIKELCLEPLGISVTAAAEGLGISRKTLSSIINGRAGISPEMAIRLSIAFDTSAESWLNQQSQFDLWKAEQNRDSLHVHRLSAEEVMGDPIIT
jgi:addiction module HigA family antidote